MSYEPSKNRKKKQKMKKEKKNHKEIDELLNGKGNVEREI